MIILNFTLIKKVDLQNLQAKIRDGESEVALLKELNSRQAKTIERIRGEVENSKRLDLIDIDIGDPTPDNQEDRKQYVTRVAAFYKDVLEKKCLQMISVFHRLLEEETNNRETDNILKIGVYVCREWMKWGNQSVNEALSYQIEPPQTTLEQKETDTITTQL